jgi:hypothetical protein
MTLVIGTFYEILGPYTVCFLTSPVQYEPVPTSGDPVATASTAGGGGGGGRQGELHIRMHGTDFTWIFLLANVQFPILGMDF